MEEAKFNQRATFSEFVAKHAKDSRFEAIEKMKDREASFNEFMAVQGRKKKKIQRQEVRRLNQISLNCYLIITWTVNLGGAK